MTFDLTTQDALIEAITCKTIVSRDAVILSVIGLANKQKEENWNGDLFIGTLSICSDAKVDFQFEGVSGNETSLTVNTSISNTGFKFYDNVVFDKIIAGEEYRLNSECEAIFSGYKYVLQQP